MRVLIANKFFFRNGGSEVVMFQERSYLQKSGVHVVDFSMDDPRNVESPYREYFVRHRAYGNGGGGISRQIANAVSLIHSREAVSRIGGLIENERPDIVHCHNIYHQLTPSIIGAAKRRGIPVVLTLHDYKTVCPVYTRLRNGSVCSDCLDGKFLNVLRHRCADGSFGKSAILYAEAIAQKLLRSYERVDAVLAPSHFMAKSVTRHRFAGDRVHVLYNGIDLREISASKTDKNYILYMGRLTPEKGVATLLEAHAQMSDGLDLRIAGTGPLEEDLRRRYSRARFIGYVSGDALCKTIEEASVVVAPSEWYENCPMSVLEAMAYGKPVIASNIGGIPELVSDGETGFLFEAGNREALRVCLEKVMNSPAMRARLGAAGRKRVEECFTAEQHFEKLMGVYSSLL